MDFQVEALEEALQSLGAVLEQRHTPYGLLVVGGSSLLLLGLIDRPTGDLDVVGLAEDGRYHKIAELPAPLASAAAQVGRALDLADNWLNTGPASLMDFGLPESWERRIEVRRYARARGASAFAVRPDLLQAVRSSRPRSERQALQGPPSARAVVRGVETGSSLDDHARLLGRLSKPTRRVPREHGS